MVFLLVSILSMEGMVLLLIAEWFMLPINIFWGKEVRGFFKDFLNFKKVDVWNIIVINQIRPKIKQNQLR